MAGQGDVCILSIQYVRGGIHLYVVKDCAYNIRCQGIEGPAVGLLPGFSLCRLPQREDHNARNDQYKIAALHDTRKDDHAAQQRKEHSAPFSAFTLAQLLRKLFIRQVFILLFHIRLLFCLAGYSPPGKAYRRSRC